MKQANLVWIAALLAGFAGCAEDDGPAGPANKGLVFSLAAPQSVPTKQLVQLEVRVTEARLVNYPLTVTFEEANQNQSFELVATVLLQKPEDTMASDLRGGRAGSALPGHDLRGGSGREAVRRANRPGRRPRLPLKRRVEHRPGLSA